MTKTRFGMLPLIIIAVLALGMVGCGTQIPSGHRGVFYYKFGDGTEFGKIYQEGFSWHLPWNSMFVYKVQLQEQKEALTVLSSDGATIKLEVSILYRPLAPKTPHFQPTAKRVIFLCMPGGPSHVDTFDYKPGLARDDGVSVQNGRRGSARLLGSPFTFRQRGESGLWISDHTCSAALRQVSHTEASGYEQVVDPHWDLRIGSGAWQPGEDLVQMASSVDLPSLS